MFKLLTSLFLLFLSFPIKLEAEEILSWENCLQEAKANHPDLISVKEKLRQAEASQRIATSRLLPQIEGSLSIGLAKIKGQTETDSYAYGLAGRQLIFDGFKTFYTRTSSVLDVQLAEYSYKSLSSEVRGRLRTAFVDLLRAQELLKISEQIASRRKQNMELVTLRYRAGREHRGSLLNAEANMLQAQADVSQSKRNIELVQRKLLKELGRQEVSYPQVKGDFVTEDSPSKPDFESLAKNTPALLDFTVRLESARLAVKSARADFYPQVSASAAVNRSDDRWPPDAERWSAGAGLSFPLFTGGSRWAELSRRQAVFKQMQAEERSKRDSVALALQQSWTDLQDAMENVEVQKKFLAAAEERAKITQAQYSIGLVTFDNWIIIEDDLVRTKKSFLNTQANASLAEMKWAQTKGETLDEK